MSISKATKQSLIGSTLKARPSNVILYEGPSLIDGSPIVVILTGLTSGSKNDKTGAMLQTWIIRQDISPILASRLGEDRSICGDCIHRGTPNTTKEKGWADNRTCYVALNQAPTAVYNAYHRGNYKRITPEQISEVGKGRMIRLGSYGDPAAAPSWVFDALISQAKGHTGYSHASGTKGTDGKTIKVSPAFMVSADSKHQAQYQQALHKRRTFRVIDVKTWQAQGKAALLKTEVLCPASTEGYREGVTCSTCGLCNGSGTDNTRSINAGINAGSTRVTLRKSIAIVAHGTSKNKVKG